MTLTLTLTRTRSLTRTPTLTLTLTLTLTPHPAPRPTLALSLHSDQVLTLLLSCGHLNKAFHDASADALDNLTIVDLSPLRYVGRRSAPTSWHAAARRRANQEAADAAVAAVGRACSKLVALDLSGTPISDLSMGTIATKWQRLERLKLRECWHGVTADVLSCLAAHLTHLTSLDIWACSASADASVGSIAEHCTQLQWLSISDPPGGRPPPTLCPTVTP
jgi:hypothetical protein